MTKEWKQSELKRIYSDHPEFKKAPIVGLDEIVVEFLKLHDVNVLPPKKKSGIKEGAIAGALGVLAGPDLAGDAFIIEGQKEQTKKQDWTSWKQWALSHKDFPEFKNKINGEAEVKNKEIDDKLTDPDFVEKWEAYFKKTRDQEFVRKQKANLSRVYFFIVIFAIIASLIGIENSPEAQKFLRIERREFKNY